MNNYELDSDQVILYKNSVFRDDIEGNLDLTLTSKKIIFEQTQIHKTGFFKTQTQTETIVIDKIILKTIKRYNEKVQVHQKNTSVDIQTTENNYTIKFNNIMEAVKFTTKVIDATTETTMSDRGAEKVKKTFQKVDDVLGFNTRDTIKGVIENGIAGTLLKGIKKK